jgi:hypothetical protein
MLFVLWMKVQARCNVEQLGTNLTYRRFIIFLFGPFRPALPSETFNNSGTPERSFAKFEAA